MDAETKNWIDAASVEDLLRKWRCAPIGDAFFASRETSDYLWQRMQALRAADPAAYTAASKRIG